MHQGQLELAHPEFHATSLPVSPPGRGRPDARIAELTGARRGALESLADCRSGRCRLTGA
jgi:hypothetical protein